MSNFIRNLDLDKKVLGINFFTINSRISSGKMHGQAENIKPLGFVSISVEGYTGISEIYAATYISIGLKSIFEYLDHFIKGKTLKETSDIIKNLSIPFVSRNGIFNASVGSLENAYLDLCAKIENIPLYKMLGDNNTFPKIYASGGSVICSKEEIKEESLQVESLGYDGYKIRVGLQEWDVDKERIKKMSDLKIHKMVDGICGTRVPCWSYNEALEKLKFLENEGIYWLEEPLHPDSYQDYSALQSQTNMHIAAGEAYSGAGELKNLIDIGNIDVIQFDACHSGGISVCKKISDYSNMKNKKTALHVWGSAVAIQTNFHLALALGNLDFLEKPLIELEIDKLIGQEFITLERLKGSIKEKPGIGIEIEDFKKIKIDNSFGYEYKW
jgi:L-rhamnonate dehydratase